MLLSHCKALILPISDFVFLSTFDCFLLTDCSADIYGNTSGRNPAEKLFVASGLRPSLLSVFLRIRRECQFPAFPLWRSGQRQVMALPMHIHGQIQKLVILIFCFRVSFTEQNTNMSEIALGLGPPGILTVVGQIRIAAGQIIHQPQLPRGMQDGMLPAEVHKLFPKYK